MKIANCLLLLTTITGCSSHPVMDTAYLKIGVGYKFDEHTIYSRATGKKFDDPISARIELGAECFIPELKCGIAHHSQWGTGWPIDDVVEPFKNEVFFDYELKLNKLF